MCEHSNKIHAYHDGELDAPQRAAFKAHLASCDSCRVELNALQAISRSLAAAALAASPADLASRTFDTCKRARRSQDDGARRLAGWLTAAAAIVLLIAMLRVSVSSPRPAENLSAIESTGAASRDWEIAAIMPPAQVDDTGSGSTELTQIAQWMARDLSPDERR